MRSILILLVCSFLVFGCKEKNENTNQIATNRKIDHPTGENIPNPTVSIVNQGAELGQIIGTDISSPSWIIGEDDGNDDEILGEIKGMVSADDYLIVLDSKFNDLRVYDLQAQKMTNRYLLSGKGPGEFLSPSSISYHRDSSTLFVSDRFNKVNVYSFEQGEIEFQYQIDFKFVPTSTCVVKDQLIVSGIKVENEDSDEVKRTNIHSYSIDEGLHEDSFGSTYISDNWLTVNQL